MLHTVAHNSSKLSPKWRRRITHLQDLSRARDHHWAQGIKYIRARESGGLLCNCRSELGKAIAFLDEKSCDRPDATLARGPLTLPGIERRTALDNYGALKSQKTYETYPCLEATQRTNNPLAGLGTSDIVERTFRHSSCNCSMLWLEHLHDTPAWVNFFGLWLHLNAPLINSWTKSFLWVSWWAPRLKWVDNSLLSPQEKSQDKTLTEVL